ncbi:unnamed protein product, partial [Ranitomeya imitator]
EKDCLIRWISVLGNIFDQLYYPCEHMAWAADAGVFHIKSDKWWAASTAFWGLSLVVGIIRNDYVAPPLWEVEPHIHFSNQRSHVTAEQWKNYSTEDCGTGGERQDRWKQIFKKINNAKKK